VPSPKPAGGSTSSTSAHDKAERFIQTSLREWTYARAYLNSQQRARELPFFMHRYNWHRPHASIGAKPPITRLGLTKDNLLRLHS
jgi:transposase InsO family protein